MRVARTFLMVGFMLGLAGTLVAAESGIAPTGGEEKEGGGLVNPAATEPQAQYWFGVAVENIPPFIAKQLKLKAEQGLIVAAVMPDSPAEKAGLRPYDLLVELNGVPLTSQTDLALAANSMETVNGSLVPKSSRIRYRREGDPAMATLTPALRPTRMMVLGGNLADFSAHAGSSTMPSAMKTINYVLPNGGAAQVGPGYRMNLSGGDSSALSMKSIREIVSKGQTLVLTQTTDAAGVTHNTISVGDKSYPVEAGRLEALPEELRPLGKQLLAGMPSDVKPDTTAPAVEPPVSPEQQRVKDLEMQNEQLRAELSALKAQKGN